MSPKEIKINEKDQQKNLQNSRSNNLNVAVVMRNKLKIK